MIEDVIRFWFQELEPKQHFAKNPRLDKLIKSRFEEIYRQVLVGDQDDKIETAEGCLAIVLVLDQFSRNIFRNQAQAFAGDTKALNVAQYAVKNGFDKLLTAHRCSFLYMPYMHSEDEKVHEKAVELFTQLGIASTLNYERRHKEIIDRFGRYPHRNEILGRSSTPEEITFLNQAGSSF